MIVLITYETRAAITASFMLICLIDAREAELYEEAGVWGRVVPARGNPLISLLDDDE